MIVSASPPMSSSTARPTATVVARTGTRPPAKGTHGGTIHTSPQRQAPRAGRPHPGYDGGSALPTPAQVSWPLAPVGLGRRVVRGGRYRRGGRDRGGVAGVRR